MLAKDAAARLLLTNHEVAVKSNDTTAFLFSESRPSDEVFNLSRQTSDTHPTGYRRYAAVMRWVHRIGTTKLKLNEPFRANSFQAIEAQRFLIQMA